MAPLEQFNRAVVETNTTSLSMSLLTHDARLVIVGGLDLSYYHEFELTFSGVTYIACETVFDPARLRQSTEAEASALKKEIDFESGTLFCFESTFDARVSGRVVAAEVSFRKNRVYYYDRSALEPGESIASWVKNR
jgi:hypothetical protein